MPQLVATHGASMNHPAWLVILRIALGVILLWKGINFIRDTAEVEALIQQTGIEAFSKSSGLFASMLSVLTLLCGFFITVGLFTRWASIVQAPIIILAILFVTGRNMEQNSAELILTISVFILLVLFAIKGSGPLSADEYFRRGAAIDRKERDTF